MPFDCQCGARVSEDDAVCPDCGQLKTSWTLAPEQTRTFSVSGRRLKIQRGAGQGPVRASEGPWPGEERIPTESVRAIPKAVARALADEGKLPPSRDALCLRLVPGQHSRLDVSLDVVFATEEPRSHEFPLPTPSPPSDAYERWFLFVYGEGSAAEIDLPGVEIVDVSEETPAGFAPTVEVTALDKRPKELPVEGPPTPRAYLLEMEDVHFHHDSCVLLPDTGAGSEDTSGRLNGLEVLWATLLHLELFPEQRLLITGHTDTSGATDYNLELSRQRAESVRCCLAGERDAWVELSQGKHQVEDIQCILAWADRTAGWGSDPGPVDGVTGPKTRAGIEAFQERYNQEFGASIAVDGLVGRQTWGAVFDVYERALADMRGHDTAELAHERGKLKFVDPAAVGCGEAFPIEASRQDNYRSTVNRRVELLFFDPGEEPRLACHGSGCEPSACPLFGEGNYRFEYLQETRIRLVDGVGQGLSGQRILMEFLQPDGATRSTAVRASDSNGEIGMRLAKETPVRLGLAPRAGGRP